MVFVDIYLMKKRFSYHKFISSILDLLFSLIWSSWRPLFCNFDLTALIRIWSWSWLFKYFLLALLFAVFEVGFFKRFCLPYYSLTFLNFWRTCIGPSNRPIWWILADRYCHIVIFNLFYNAFLISKLAIFCKT